MQVVNQKFPSSNADVTAIKALKIFEEETDCNQYNPGT